MSVTTFWIHAVTAFASIVMRSATAAFPVFGVGVFVGHGGDDSDGLEIFVVGLLVVDDVS